MVGACFAALPSCGGGGNLGVKHSEFWTTAVTKLMSGLHDILDVLYSPVETGLCFLLPFLLMLPVVLFCLCLSASMIIFLKKLHANLPSTLMVKIEQLVHVCVCFCVRPDNNCWFQLLLTWIGYLACWFTLPLSRMHLWVTVIGQGFPSHKIFRVCLMINKNSQSKFGTMAFLWNRTVWVWPSYGQVWFAISDCCVTSILAVCVLYLHTHSGFVAIFWVTCIDWGVTDVLLDAIQSSTFCISSFFIHFLASEGRDVASFVLAVVSPVPSMHI